MNDNKRFKDFYNRCQYKLILLYQHNYMAAFRSLIYPLGLIGYVLNFYWFYKMLVGLFKLMKGSKKDWVFRFICFLLVDFKKWNKLPCCKLHCRFSQRLRALLIPSFQLASSWRDMHKVIWVPIYSLSWIVLKNALWQSKSSSIQEVEQILFTKSYGAFPKQF